MRILKSNAPFHDPAAAPAVDGRTVTAAEEERFGRRGHGRRPLSRPARELPGRSARRCPRQAGPRPAAPDAVADSFDPAPGGPTAGDRSDALLRFGSVPAGLPATGPHAVRWGRAPG
ncbi:hypothetical protein [Streptomyces griseoloalbus]|uniref:Uncharacterized protein n=1 Tax=Streptomyces griseoloalbus TaxID=67303 RepID=A0A7W8BJE0_9ACTN|nr:hypothetical protein [Streptomyces albaduncus]GGV72065.1 hypothetical protein GCM10010294_32120 [Streptomyces griseoloalbus]GGW74817.1 hypothetical protein GCM10010340_61680 [Streptomyces albaduncus]